MRASWNAGPAQSCADDDPAPLEGMGALDAQILLGERGRAELPNVRSSALLPVELVIQKSIAIKV